MSYLLLLVIILFTTSCYDSHSTDKLNLAESLVWENADSALKVLATIPSPEQLQGQEQADYALLFTQASYRNQKPASSDSLINLAAAYYEDKHPIGKRVAALFYKGAVWQELKKDEEAMLAYKEAESYIPQLSEGRLKACIYDHIANLNRIHNNPELAIAYYRKAIAVNAAEGQLAWRASNLMNVANLFYMIGCKDSTDFYYQKLLAMAPLIDSTLQAKIYYNMAFYSKEAGYWEEVEKYTLQSLKVTNNRTSYRTLALLADTYNRTGQKEKTDSLWKEALRTSDMALRATIYYNLYSTAVLHQEYQKAIELIEQYMLAVDAFRSQTNQVALMETQKKYDKEVLLRKNAEANSRFYASVLILILVLVVGVSLYWVGWRLYKQRMKELLARNVQKSAELRQAINRFRLKIEEDETMHKDEKEKLLEKIESLESEKVTMDKKVNQYMAITGSKDKELNVSIELIEGMKVVSKIKSDKAASYDPGVDRDKLCCFLNAFYANFATRLADKYALTQREQDICYLKALHLSDDEIANVLHLDLRSVDRNVSRLRGKAGFKHGRDEFAHFIMECLSSKD